jgi:hypothetical protein
MMIEAVGGRGLGGDGDGRRGLRSPVVGMRGVIGRVKVGRGRGERKGRQVGQFERFLFSAEGSVNGMRGGLFTVISILRGVCYGRIVSSGRGRVTHLRVTDDKPGSRLPLFPRQLSCLASVCIDNRPLVSISHSISRLGETAGLANSLVCRTTHSSGKLPLLPLASSRAAALRASCIGHSSRE